MAAESAFLTFDDGPSEWTSQILDLLEQHGVTAAFFVCGGSIIGYEPVLRRMRDAGHLVGNHSYSHAKMTAIPLSRAFVELERTSRMIHQAIGEHASIWRPPFFATNPTLDELASNLGMRRIGSNIIPDDWQEEDPDVIYMKTLERWKPDGILTLHDGIPPGGGSPACTDSRRPTVQAVQLLIDEGMSFAPILALP